MHEFSWKVCDNFYSGMDLPCVLFLYVNKKVIWMKFVGDRFLVFYLFFIGKQRNFIHRLVQEILVQGWSYIVPNISQSSPFPFYITNTWDYISSHNTSRSKSSSNLYFNSPKVLILPFKHHFVFPLPNYPKNTNLQPI